MAYTEQNHPGRAECDYLRWIRVRIADDNGIEFRTNECHNTKPCTGTCPLCDDEIRYLEAQLKERGRQGETLIFDTVSLTELAESGLNETRLFRAYRKPMYGGIKRNADWLETRIQIREQGMRWGCWENGE